MSQENIRFGIVAGEASGDLLGASLIEALKKQFPNATFEGVGGERMIAQGFHSYYPIERLSVMGLIEPLKRLPELLKLRKWLVAHFIKLKPHIFIGIDSPDFNLSIEKALKQCATLSHTGTKTVHVVSPTVWAWRKGRIHTIKQAVDLMLTLFPFETEIYQKHAIPVRCIGHPLADSIPLRSDKNLARQMLGIKTHSKTVALLPGSRAQELKYLAKPFIETAMWLEKQDPDIQFISASASIEREQQFKSILKECGFSNIHIFPNQSLKVMQASDAILVTSGTATLEAMLVKRPTVIAYKTSFLTYSIGKRLIKVPYIGLPNLLAGSSIMPEFIQSEVIPEKMGQVIWNDLQTKQDEENRTAILDKIHQSLKCQAADTAAQAITQLLLKSAFKN